jgi:D-3-phosphoglycerate dehydrogenase / 2-oxoglutarate reductase
MKALLLEKVHKIAKTRLEEVDFKVEEHSPSETGPELSKRLKGVDVLGIRSKSLVTSAVLEGATELSAIGAFCIGTNQIDLKSATREGIAVFNAPFANTRSVAELVLAEIIALSRGLFSKAFQMHLGEWNKSSNGCYEVRGKKLGIIGYGHIGSQLGILGEALGLKVHYYDIQKKLPLGNAVSESSLKKLLGQCDFISLHVPQTEQTQNMITEKEIDSMKKGSFLINASRGTVVDLVALKKALKSGHIAGAAIDVFPKEPKENQDVFSSPLQKIDNVILTPHIGGSTEEAQEAIGVEVSESLIKYMATGDSFGSVNFPHLNLRPLQSGFRILNVHKNVPGVLGAINKIISEYNVNISSQQLGTNSQIGYLAMDLEKKPKMDVIEKIQALDTSIKTRLIF